MKALKTVCSIAMLISASSFAGTDDAAATIAAGASAGVEESPSKRFMQLVERHNLKDKNFSSHLSCREVFTGNGYNYSKKTGGVQGVSQQYMAVMGLNFLRQACRCEESVVRRHLVKTPVSSLDVLSQNRYLLGGRSPQTEKEILVNEFAILYTLGQRESSGNFNEGRDLTMTKIFTKSKQWEAGVFQASADSLELDVSRSNRNHSLSMGGISAPLTKQVFSNYLQTLSGNSSLIDRRIACDLPVLAGSKTSKTDVSGGDLQDLFGASGSCAKTAARIRNGSTFNAAKISSNNSDDIHCFRGLNKNCPAFAIEYAAVTSRVNRMHWGPLRKLGTETKFERPYIVPACAGFFEELYDNRESFCELASARQELPGQEPLPDPSPELPPGQELPDGKGEVPTQGNPPAQGEGDGKGAPPAVDPPPSPPPSAGPPPASPPPVAVAAHNPGILRAQRSLRDGGTYDVSSSKSVESLKKAISYKDGKLVVDGSEGVLTHGHCSTASYAVFTKTLSDLQKAGKLNITPEVADALMPSGAQLDGTGIWGRWNANGPGTAMLFKELNLGTNFVDSKIDGVIAGAKTQDARVGDFIKIFWRWGGQGNEAVGQTEKGHLAVFKGYQKDAQGKVLKICYWTANQGSGFSDKCVDKEDVAHAIFSRLERPENISKAPDLVQKSPTNPYLQRIGNRKDGKESSSYEAALREVGVLK